MNEAEIRTLPDDVKRNIRYVSTYLKGLGFRPGAPILRATQGFTLTQLVDALLSWHNRRVVELTLSAAKGDEVIFTLESVSPYDGAFPSDDYDSLLFPRELHESPRGLRERHWFILDGGLQYRRYSPSTGELDADDLDYQLAATHWKDEPLTDAVGTAIPFRQNIYLSVRVVVAFDSEGEFISAVYQRVPSPADDVLTVPPIPSA